MLGLIVDVNNYCDVMSMSMWCWCVFLWHIVCANTQDTTQRMHESSRSSSAYAAYPIEQDAPIMPDIKLLAIQK